MKSDKTSQLGEYLRTLRQARGLTSRQLGQLAGCSHSFITRLETGERLTNLGQLWQIVAKLEGDFGQVLFLLCLDSGVPEEIAHDSTLIKNPNTVP